MLVTQCADGVLREILAGHAADPPGLVLYHAEIDGRGRPKVDRLG